MSDSGLGEVVWGLGLRNVDNLFYQSMPIQITGTTHTSTHGSDHDDGTTLWHELGGFKSTEPSSHDVDIEKLSDLLGRVVVGDIVLDNTSGGNEGLIMRGWSGPEMKENSRQFVQTCP